MTSRFSGGCACGAIRSECTAEPIMAGHCQCVDCQKSSGAGHGSHLAVPKAAVKLTGRPSEYRRKADSGSTVTHGFCPTCGSPIYGESSGMPGMITLRAGSLDDPGRFRPQMVVYTARGRAWDHLDPALPRFERMPPMPPSDG
jgi:hypothetical protein